MVHTGIASAFSDNFAFVLKERGSTGTRGVGQRAGIIDSGYRNEWLVPLTNHNVKTVVIAKYTDDFDPEKFIVHPYSKAIAQALLVPVPKVETEEIGYDELQCGFESERGLGRLGSSGK